jgi:Ca-activated chloride channel family protein
MTQDRTMTDEPLPTDRDDLHDRLLDRALRERVGGEKAPDFAEKIVAAAKSFSPAAAAVIENPVSPMPFRWGWLAIAASLLVAVGIGLLSPAIHQTRERATRSAASATNVERAASKEEAAQPPSTEHRVLVEQMRRTEKVGGPSPGQVTADFPGAQARPEVMLGVGVNDDAAEPQSSRGGRSGNQLQELQRGTAFGPSAAATPGSLGDETFAIDSFMTYDAEAAGAGQQQVENRYGESAPTAAQVTAGDGQFAGGGRAAGDAVDWEELSLRRKNRFARPGVPAQSEDSRTSQQLLDLEVMKQVTMQQASSSSGLETAVAAEMDKDPTIGMYKEQLFVIDQQIQQLPAGSRNSGNSQLTLLRGQYGQVEESLRQYRIKAEREARGRLGGSLEEERRARIEEMVKRESERRARGDNYASIVDNPFRAITADSADNRLSTFSIDVDTASYANVRQFLMQSNMLPPPDAVRIEELVNYFTYDYAGPGESDEPVARNAAMMEARMAAANRPFAANIEVAACPWAPKHRLVRFGIKGREVARAARPKSNLVFLVDVSGSMDDPQKLPLLIDGMRMLTQELGENDRVAIVVYASTEGLALESTRGDQQEKILAALDRLSAGGSTAGGAGIQLAYKVAADNFIEGGTNRVILCTDGDFNVGVTDVEALKQLAADKAKDTGVFLTVLGFGRGNLNDELMEAVADNGNGAYHYVDNRSEARKVLVEQMTGTLVTIAKDVKIQVEFNPTQVAAYRLIGYENRVLAAEDFNNDAKDAGEIGAGHTVTALYEIVPIGEEVATTNVDELKYAPVTPAGDPPAEAGSPDVDDQKYSADAEASSELLTLKIRYKQPDGDTSTKLEFPVTDAGLAFSKASSDFQFASSVAGFGMLLRGSPYKGDATFAGMLEIAESSVGNEDPHGYRREFTQVIAKAKQLSGE